MHITNGSTRTVILTKRFAIKLPVFVRFTKTGKLRLSDYRSWWPMFRYGFTANRKERRISRLNHPQLCPVLFADRWGFMVIMPRCEPAKGIASWREHISDRALCPVEYTYLRSQGLPIDNYNFNFGYLKEQLVCFDYGT